MRKTLLLILVLALWVMVVITVRAAKVYEERQTLTCPCFNDTGKWYTREDRQ